MSDGYTEQRKTDLLKAKVRILESMIEDRSREIFQANEQLKSAADFLQDIYRTMPSALLIIDQFGKVESANESACSLLGYSEEQLKLLKISHLLDPENPLRKEELARLGESQVLRTEKTCIDHTGTKIPVLVSASVLYQQETALPPKIICVATDLRSQKQLEIELRQAQKLESVGRLAAGVAHEINTPVQFVNDSVHFVNDTLQELLSLLEQLQHVNQSVIDDQPDRAAAEACQQTIDDADLDYLQESLPKALVRALDGLERIATIVRSMKEFAHPDAKEMAPADINRAIESTLVIARNEYKYVADIELRLGALPKVVCHLGDINQVILNIVVNAAHAIEEKVRGSNERGKITVTTHLEDDHVCISIADTGGGIPDKIRAQIFDPFFTTKEVGKGTGQGLAIAHLVIVERHHGRIDIETTLGQGTTFLLRFPIQGSMESSS